MVQLVLTSMTVYLLMALDLPPWALKAIASAYVGSCGRAAKMLEGDIASLLGLG